MNLPKVPPTLPVWATGLMFSLPFLAPWHRLPVPTFYNEWLAGLLGLLASGLLFLSKPAGTPRIPFIALLPLGTAALIMVQAAAGMLPYIEVAILGSSYLIWATLLVIAGYLLRTTLGLQYSVRLLALSLLASGVISSIIAILQAMGLDGGLVFDSSGRGMANMAQSNHLANYLGLALGSAAYLRLTSRLKTALYLPIIFMLLTGLALSGSRSTWLYLVLVAALSLWFSSMHAPAARRQRLEALALVPLFAAVQWFLPWLLRLGGAEVPEMPSQRIALQWSSVSVRWLIWQEAWSMFWHHPWLGVGFEQFHWESFLLKGSAETAALPPTEHAHNIVLQFLAEFGLAGGLLLAWAAGHWLTALFRAPRQVEHFWLWALIGVTGLHSLLEYPLWHAHFLGIAAVILGMGSQSHLRLTATAAMGKLLAAACGLLLVQLVSLGGSYLKLEMWVNRAIVKTIEDKDLKAFQRDLQSIEKSQLRPYAERIYAQSISPAQSSQAIPLGVYERAMQFMPEKTLAEHYAGALTLAGNVKRASEINRLARASFLNGIKAE